MRRFALQILTVLALALAGVTPAIAQAVPDSAGGGIVQPGASMRVFIVTIGQGDEIWEKFGHNAIWLFDESEGLDVAYNYGMFAFDQPGYIGRLVKGEMKYWMEGFQGSAMVNYYRQANRSIWLQELRLTTAQMVELRAYLQNNALEENKYYTYDYYRDNCSTRVRDAIDHVTNGALRRQMVGQATGTTYRSHTQRLTAEEWPAYTGLMLAMGETVDRPIDAWEESFLPVQLMEHIASLTVPDANGEERPLVINDQQLFEAARPPERLSAPNRLLAYLAAGVLLAAILVLLHRAAPRNRAAAIAFATLALVFSLVTGVFGTLIAYLWMFTQHMVTYRNENVLQANVLSLVLFVGLILLATGRARLLTARVAVAIAALAVLGFLIQALPWLDQVNGPIIALLLPVHLALAWSLWMRRDRGRLAAERPVEQKRKAAA
jgi:Domain of unknown function (DUF4105)